MWPWSLIGAAAALATAPGTHPTPLVPPQQASIDSLFIQLHHVNQPAALKAIDCAARPRKTVRLCTTLVAVRRAELTDSAADAHAADRAAQRLLLDTPGSAVAWYALGIARLQLVATHALGAEGPLQPVGVSNEAAAGYAFVHALELDSSFAPAANALALGPLPPPREGASRLGERVAMLRRVRELLSPQALYGAGLVEVTAGNPDSAAKDLRQALALGNPDSGTVLLTLARAEYQGGHADAGRSAFIAGTRDTASAARASYREMVSWVASPEELQTWDSLPAASRPAWFADFWARRDVAEGHADGARLIEHWRRYETAMKLYPVMLPGTGRNRVAQNQDIFDHTHIDFQPTGGYSSSTAGEQSAGVGNMGQHFWGVQSPFMVVPITQNVLDDRGVVYMRHGKPDAVGSGGNVSGTNLRKDPASSVIGSVAIEVWTYNLPDGPLTLSFINQDFSSDVGASRLIPTLFGAKGAGDLCAFDFDLCPISHTETGGLAHLKGAYDRGVANIRRALNTDSDWQPFRSAMHPVMQIYGLRRVDDESPRLVMPFAIPGDDLSSTTDSASGRTVYTVSFRFSAENHASGQRSEQDTVRRFVTGAPLRRGQFLTGVAELPIPVGSYGVSLTVGQRGGRGAIARVTDFTVGDAAGPLSLSDLVLGREGSGATWSSGDETVALNPLNTFPARSSAAVYFQLHGLVPGQSYTTKFDFVRAGDDSTAAPRLTVSSQQTAATASTEVVRSLGLQNLDPGHYRVRLTVTGAGASATSTAWLTIVK
jgi:hypothetical protein